jgi:Transposase
VSRRGVGSGPVVIAVDPHKRSWTAVAVDGSLQPQRSVRVEANRDGYRELRRFARGWAESRWAIEGAGGLGAPLATRLLADGLSVLDVPTKLAARVRALSTWHGRKTDEADAVSVGVVAWTATSLGAAAASVCGSEALASSPVHCQLPQCATGPDVGSSPASPEARIRRTQLPSHRAESRSPFHPLPDQQRFASTTAFWAVQLPTRR